MTGEQRCVTINAGGTRYTTTTSTLLSEANSYFTCLLSGGWDDTAQAELFIDRDGDLFKHILRFLRASPSGKVHLVQSLSRTDRIALIEEANFFQLESLRQLLGQADSMVHPAPLELQSAYWINDQGNPRIAELNAKTVALLTQGWEVISFAAKGGVHDLLLACRKA